MCTALIFKYRVESGSATTGVQYSYFLTLGYHWDDSGTTAESQCEDIIESYFLTLGHHWDDTGTAAEPQGEARQAGEGQKRDQNRRGEHNFLLNINLKRNQKS